MQNLIKSYLKTSFIVIITTLIPLLALEAQETKPSLAQVKKTLIIYLENHSFFNLFANFPGADNQTPKEYKGQIDKDGMLYQYLPPVTKHHTTTPDPRFSKKLFNKPFLIDQFVQQHEMTPDPSHEFFTHQVQLNNGLNNQFVLYSKAGALPMGYFDMKATYLWKLAKEYVLADQFYQSAFGGSFLNHQWFIAAQTPFYANASEDLKMKLDKNGLPEKVKPLTPDHYVVNTIQPQNPPFESSTTDIKKRLPPLEYATIGERLSEKKITWAWYAGGWNAILKGENTAKFQYHHQPFLYFKNYGPDTPGRKEHLKDEDDLIKAIAEESLPEVSFYKPVGAENAHPGYTDISSGVAKIEKVIELLKKSQQWQSTLVIITFDEHGGFWDPKAPKKIDRWGPGTRIPTLFVSPLLKKGFIDHTPYETVSILSFLEKKYSLPPLTDRDKNADPLSGVFSHP